MVQRVFRAQGLEVVAVSTQESRGAVAAWAKGRALGLPILLDTDGAVSKAYRVTGVPTTVLIDRAGRLVGRAFGARSWDAEGGRTLIATLLLGPPAR